MRTLKILAWTVGGLVVVVAGLFGALQVAPVQRWAAETVSKVASTPDQKIELRGLSGFFPTDLALAGVTLADRQGVWLAAEDIRLDWSFAPLLRGRLQVDAMTVQRLHVDRPPLPAETKAPPSEGGGGLPVGIDLQSLSIADLHLGKDLAGVDSHWKLAAAALLPADRSPGNLRLTLDRTDGPDGRLSADLRFDLEQFNVDGKLSFTETAPEGVIATMIGRPDLDRTAVDLTLRGDAANGNVDFSAAAGNAVTSTGTVQWQRRGDDTRAIFRLNAATENLPDGPLTRALAPPLTLDGEATLDGAGVWRLERASLQVGVARLDASGRYDTTADRLDGTVDIEAPEAGGFTDLLGGAAWRDLRATVRAEFQGLARRPSGTASLVASVAEVASAPPGRIDLAAKLRLQPDGRLVIEESNLSSAGTVVQATGSYLPSDESGEVKVTVDAANLAPYGTLAGLELAGRGRLELTTKLQKDRVRATWQAVVDGLGVPSVPEHLLGPSLRSSGSATLQGQDWGLDEVRLASDAVSLQVDGRGRDRNGEIKLAVTVPRIEALQPEVKGRLSVTTNLSFEGEAAQGEATAEGVVADQPLNFTGRFRRDADGGMSMPEAQGRWASAVIDVRNLAVTPGGATGSGQLRMTRLQDLAPLIGTDIAGALELDIATEGEAGGTVRVALRGNDLRSAGMGAGTVRLDGSVRDPFGVAEADAKLEADRIVGVEDISRLEATVKGDRRAFDVALRAGGGRANATLAARIEQAGEEIRLGLSKFEGRYRELVIALAGPAKATIVGERVSVDPANLRLGAGRVRVGGVIDPQASDFNVDIAALPLNVLAALAPGTNIEGVLQAKLQMRGPSANPRIDATYNASGLRLRQPGMGLVPALAVQGSASVAERRATFNTRLSGGGSTNVTLQGTANLAPFAASVNVGGVVDIGPFSALMGDSIRNVAGTVRPNLRVEIAGGAVNGSGSAALNGIMLALPDSGLRLDNGQGTLVLEGNTLRLQQLTFQTAGKGQAGASGTVRLDPEQGFPLDLSVTTQRALAVNRPDLVATITSDIKVTGSTTTAIDVNGRIGIDRAEIAVGAGQAAGYPTIPVEETNLPPGRAQRAARRTAAAEQAGLPIRLNIAIEAPQAVFVRGRGLDAEMGGQFQVTGDVSRPAVLGNLNLRRGSFNLSGHRLTFSRGEVSLVTAETIDPLLDFLATTTVQSTTISLAIGGTSSAPTFTVTSSPSLPQDEAMAMLLFGKPATGLSPFELLSAADAIAELSGRSSPTTGFFSRLRRTLGLDQLSVNSAGGSGGGGGAAGGMSLGAGRYVAPGVYVGAKQGAGAGSSQGVVEIEVLPHTKIEGDIGANTNSRIGVKMEWDY